jgi:demethylmenaquinone methyltransferase/2-methoxy-6-polyprenyl-1,4-benzoquinol methylase
MAKESIAEFEPGVSRVLTSKGETRAFYNKIAKVYDLLAEHSEMPMREAGLKKLAVSSGERVLEIGFGTGHCLIELAKAVGPRGRIFGIDLSDRMLELAEDLVRSEGFTERIELRSGDAVTLPYESGSLDGVFMSFTLELFDTPEIPRVLAECRRVLRPSGRIVVVAVSKEGKQGILMEAYEWTHRHFPNLLDCRPIFARRALESAGFIIREVELQHMWVPVEIVLAATPI